MRLYVCRLVGWAVACLTVVFVCAYVCVGVDGEFVS